MCDQSFSLVCVFKINVFSEYLTSFQQTKLPEHLVRAYENAGHSEVCSIIDALDYAISLRNRDIIRVRDMINTFGTGIAHANRFGKDNITTLEHALNWTEPQFRNAEWTEGQLPYLSKEECAKYRAKHNLEGPCHVDKKTRSTFWLAFHSYNEQKMKSLLDTHGPCITHIHDGEELFDKLE